MPHAFSHCPCLTVFAVCLLSAAPALAIDVSQPEVTKGALELRNANVVAWDKHDNAAARHVDDFQIGYGITDDLALKGILAIEGADGEATHAAIASVEATYEIVDVQKNGWGLAWYTLVDMQLDDKATSDTLFGPIFKLNIGKAAFVTNTFAVRSFGENRTPGTDFYYAWLASYEVAHGWKLGVEGDGSVQHLFHVSPMEEQQHRLGPVLFTEFNVGEQVVTLDLGAQFGLTDPCPDTEVKVIFGTVF